MAQGIAIFDGIFNAQANGITGPVPICTILRLNSFWVGKYLLQIIAASKMLLIQLKIIKIELIVFNSIFKLLVDE